MLLVCTHAFGNFVPGNEIEVPEGAVYDGSYFEQAEPVQAPTEESK